VRTNMGGVESDSGCEGPLPCFGLFGRWHASITPRRAGAAEDGRHGDHKNFGFDSSRLEVLQLSRRKNFGSKPLGSSAQQQLP